MSPPPAEPSTARFTQIYDDHYTDVLRFVTRRAHPLNVDDIVSETFIAAWMRCDALSAPVLPWLYCTARNVMLNQVRGSVRRQALAVRIATIAPADGDDVGDVERRLDLQGAFALLSSVDQEVLALRVWDDLDPRSAAAVIGCSRSTYSMRLTRARRRLAALLSESTSPVANPKLIVRNSS
jgi:RNA polymerase sigma factor (sigma-70 family)